MPALADVYADRPESTSDFFPSVFYGSWGYAGQVLYICPLWSNLSRLCGLSLYLPVVLSILDKFTERRLGKHLPSKCLSLK